MKTSYVKRMNVLKTSRGVKVTVVRRVNVGAWTWKDMVTKRYMNVSEASTKRVFAILRNI